MNSHIHFVFILLISWTTFVDVRGSTCPCKDQRLCRPINGTVRNEVFVFSITNSTEAWLKYDWSKITTVVAVKFIPELVCIGHQHGAKVVFMREYPLEDLENATARTEWVKQMVTYAEDNFLDGLNIDFEEPISKWHFIQRNAYTALVTETFQAFKAANQHYQVTIDVPYSPNCIYNRCYDYEALSSVTDFLVVMAYDEWDRQEAQNFAGPIGNYVKTTTGILDYMNLDIPAFQLLLAVPWYGDVYPCVTLSEDKRQCNLGTIYGVAQVRYWNTTQNLLNISTTGPMWDNVTLSNFFNFKSGNMTWQLWYDDPVSLSIKYNFALNMDIRGVGMWHAECVVYDIDPEGFKKMWAALPRYNNTAR